MAPGVLSATGEPGGDPADMAPEKAARPRLAYYFAAADGADGAWRLAYIAEDVPRRGAGNDGGGHPQPQIFDYVVDAHSGDLVAALPRGQTVEPVAADPPAGEGAPA